MCYGSDGRRCGPARGEVRGVVPASGRAAAAAADGGRGPGSGPRRDPGGGRAAGVSESDVSARAWPSWRPARSRWAGSAGPAGAARRLVGPGSGAAVGAAGAGRAGRAGDPMSPLRWTTKSTRNARRRADPARVTGSAPDTVGRPAARGRASACRPTPRPSRAASTPTATPSSATSTSRPATHRDAGQPVISVDTRRRNSSATYKNGGRQWRPDGRAGPGQRPRLPRPRSWARPIPYGIYDLAANTGWVTVGTDHDTAAFAVESIRRWWHARGRHATRTPTRLLITADAGGSNGYRTRAWKTELAALAAETGLAITVCHLPPGTSKWNKIEHRLFSPHHHELARPAPDQPRRHRAVHRRDHHPHRPDRPRRTRHRHLPHRHQDQRRAASPPCPSPATTSTATGTTPCPPPAAPRAAGEHPARTARAAGIDRDILRHPALTGMSRDQLDDLTGHSPTPRPCSVNTAAVTGAAATAAAPPAPARHPEAHDPPTGSSPPSSTSAKPSPRPYSPNSSASTEARSPAPSPKPAHSSTNTDTPHPPPPPDSTPDRHHAYIAHTDQQRQQIKSAC